LWGSAATFPAMRGSDLTPMWGSDLTPMWGISWGGVPAPSPALLYNIYRPVPAAAGFVSLS
jgi:hypothetical protein